jgi:drug/metabolite transporter (DMT)-like permease
MSSYVFAMVLAAAALHAGWNALVKGGADKALSMVAVVIGQGIFGLAVLPFAATPDWACWPWLVAGVALHLGYQLFLLNSYRFGDLTQVYPIARGTAPILVAAISVAFLGVTLGQMELLAIALIAAGIMSLALVRQADGLRNGRAAALALGTGCFIAGYSLVDGMGARVAGTALGFYGWLAGLNGLAMVALLLPVRRDLLARLPSVPVVILGGGGASFAAYALVVYAFTQAPIALVTALRETSIVFALVIGVLFLRERVDLAKVVSTFMTICGAALLRLAR